MHTQLCNFINFFHRYFYKIRLQMDFIKIHYLTINVSFNLTEGVSSYLRNIYYLDFHCSDYSQNIVVQSLEYFQNAVFQSPEYYQIVVIQFPEDIIMQLFHFLDFFRMLQFNFSEYYQNVVFKFHGHYQMVYVGYLSIGYIFRNIICGHLELSNCLKPVEAEIVKLLTCISSFNEVVSTFSFK